MGFYAQGLIEGVVSGVAWQGIDRGEAYRRGMKQFPNGFKLYRFSDWDDKSTFEVIYEYTPQGIPGLL